MGLQQVRLRGVRGAPAAGAVAPTRPASETPVAAQRAAIAETFKRDFGTPVAVDPAKKGTEVALGPQMEMLASPETPFTAPPLAPEAKRIALQQMDEKEVRGCTRCRLSQTRTNTVFGEGDPDARIFFIGEGPGESEDLQGRPFVGRAGQLLDKMIAGMGLKREQVFIANIVKCRPPGNREPAPDETAACTPYLERQIEIVRPKVIVTLGKPSSQYMLKTKLAMGKLRGQWHNWRGIKLMPTYHPAYILRNYTDETRRAVWSDLQQVMKEVGLTNASKKQAGGAE
jgi:uracil-DNA glycosylase